MTNKDDSEFGISRRSALMKIGGTAGSAALVGLTSTPAAAMEQWVHRKWARQAAEQVKSQRGNGHILVDEIAENADEPDENPYRCPDSYPWYVCAWLDDVKQPYTHYNNPEETWGKAPQKAKEKAKEARNEATDWNTNWSYVAEMTARSLHYIQDAATLVHTGKEYEQYKNNDIHFKYEGWVQNDWDSYFSDAVADARGSYDGIENADEVKDYTLLNNQRGYNKLHDNWDDISDPGSYNYSTRTATYDTIKIATQTVHGTIDWIYNG